MEVGRHRGFFESRVSRRVLTAFLLSALLPLLGFAGFMYRTVREEIEGQTSNAMRRGAREIGQLTASNLRTVDGVFLDLMTRPGAQSPDGLAGSSLVQDLFEAVWKHDPATGRDLPLLGVAGTWWAPASSDREHLEAGRRIVRSHPAGGIEVLGRLSDGSFLVGELRTSALWEADFADRDYFVIDERGSLLFSTLAGAPLPVDEILRAVSSGQTTGSRLWEAGGERLRIAHKSLFLEREYRLEWTVACVEPEAMALLPLASFRKSLILVALLTTWVVLLASMKLIRRTLVPIEILRAATERLAEDDFSASVDIHSGDELQELGESFNLMSARILDRTTRLEHASKVKMNFLANMSHELRTPMTAVLGYVELCREDDLDPAARAEYLEIVARTGKHLLRVIDDVLDVGKLEGGRMEVEWVRCDLGQVLQDVGALLEDGARAKGLEFVVRMAADVPRAIATDPTRLRQILLNLVGNGVKFTSAGRVSLDVTVCPESAGECLMFKVSDTGIGMTEAQVRHAFERFAQADSSTTRRFGGTGLGLSIASSMANLLEGRIDCSSRPGEGTVFTLVLPLRLPAPEAALPAKDSQFEPVPEPDSRTDERPTRVLLVEDVAVNRRVVSIHLRRAGFEVEEAENGLLAYERAMQAWRDDRPFDVVLMDMQMPVMDGYEATSKLREAGYPGAILALTAHSMPEERARCLEVGCDDFAGKPVKQEELFPQIARLRERGVFERA